MTATGAAASASPIASTPLATIAPTLNPTLAPTLTPTPATAAPTPAPTPAPQPFIGISGRVTDGNGSPIQQLLVWTYDATFPYMLGVREGYTDPSGRYSIALPAGSYKVLFNPETKPYLSTWWRGQRSFQSAVVVAVTASVTSMDVQLQAAVLISGRVTDRVTGLPIESVQVSASDATTQVIYYSSVLTDLDGRYVLAVPLGTYKVMFFPNSPHTGEWWIRKLTYLAADPVVVRANLSGIDAALAPK